MGKWERVEVGREQVEVSTQVHVTNENEERGMKVL